MTRTIQDLDTSAQLIALELPRLERLAQTFSTYYTGTVTLQSVVAWLLQFPTPALTASAINVLGVVNFVDDTKLASLLLRAFDTIPANDRAVAQFCTIGRSFDSGPRVSYSFAKALNLREDELASRWIDLTRPNAALGVAPLILIDDGVASGTQFTQFLAELDPTYTGPREHFDHGLAPADLEALKARTIYLTVAAELGDDRDRIIERARTLGFTVMIASGCKDTSRWLEFGNPLWRSEQEATDFRDFAAQVARQLFAGKNWSTEILETRLLGYGNSQKLTVFAHNIPKTLVSFLWKFGTVDGSPWIPLFPERNDWAQNAPMIQGGAPERSLIARMVAAGGFGKTAPTCQAFINVDGDPLESVAVRLPEDHVCDRVAKAIVNGLEPIEPPEQARPSRHVQHSSLGLTNPASMFASRYAQDSSKDAEVARTYNQKLSDYKAKVIRVALTACRLVTLPLRVYNTGNATASEVILTLELSDAITYFEELPELPKKPRKPDFAGGLFEAMAMLPNTLPKLRLAKDNRVRPNKDRGRRLLDIFIGKVVPSSFRDFSLEYLQLPMGQEIVIPYSIVYEEATRPTLGRLVLNTMGGGEPSSELLEAWRDQIES